MVSQSVQTMQSTPLEQLSAQMERFFQQRVQAERETEGRAYRSAGRNEQPSESSDNERGIRDQGDIFMDDMRQQGSTSLGTICPTRLDIF